MIETVGSTSERKALAFTTVGHVWGLIGSDECSSGGILLRWANDLHAYAELHRAQFPTPDVRWH